MRPATSTAGWDEDAPPPGDADCQEGFQASEPSGEAPRPLRRASSPPSAFPVDALGTLLGAAAVGIHETTRADVAIGAQSVLGVATFAAQAHVDVVLPMGATRPISDFFVTIAETGARKSTSDGIATCAVTEYEKELDRKHKVEYSDWKNEYATWERSRRAALKEGRGGERFDARASRAALDAIGVEPQAPLNPILLCPEPTYEGIVRHLRIGHPSIGIFSTEGGQLIGGFAMSADHRLKTAAALSNLWDGEPVRRVRASDDAFVLRGRRVAMHLMFQPTVAPLLFGDENLQGQGLLSRILPVWPESPRDRSWRSVDPKHTAVIDCFNAQIDVMLRRSCTLAEGTRQELELRKLKLSAAALKSWIAYHDYVEARIREGGSLFTIRFFANKVPEHSARLAAVLAIVDDVDCGEISRDAMERGILLSEHYVGEMLRITDDAATDATLLLSERVLRWIANGEPEADGRRRVSLPCLYQYGPAAVRDAKKAREVINVLADHGWLVKVEGGAVVRRERRRDVWQLVEPVSV